MEGEYMEHQNELAYDIATAYAETKTVFEAVDAVRELHPTVPTSTITDAWHAIDAYYDLYL